MSPLAPSQAIEHRATLRSVARIPQTSARDADDMIVARTKHLPGFGGNYKTQKGLPVVWSTRVTGVKRAYTLTKALGKEFHTAALRRGLVIREADYTFRKLNGWKHRIRTVAGEIPGLTSLDLDETHNRLVIAVEDTAVAAPTLRQLASRSAIPWVAIDVVEGSPVEPTASLHDTVRPLVSGLETYSHTATFSQTQTCTMGLPVHRNTNPSDDRDFFLLNSHCSGGWGGDQSTYVRQNGDSAVNEVAIENRDPDFQAGGDCPSNKVCRFSDSALMRVLPTVLASDVHIGGVALTASRTRTGNTAAARRIEGTRDLNTIDDGVGLYAGDEVEKVGITSGWTYGPLSGRALMRRL